MAIEQEPIEHKQGTWQFRCCGVVVTFSHLGSRYHRLAERIYVEQTGVIAGNCPFCGQRHWVAQYRKRVDEPRFD